MHKMPLACFSLLSVLLLVLPLLLGGGVLCDEVRITSADEFIEFSNSVNNRTNYTGTTVFLDSDIDFTGKTLRPIGNNTGTYFLGTFDGQGHTISNLKMDSPSQYAGVFGYSKGAIIRNVVVDSSCSVTSSEGTNVGGIIGDCQSSNNSCIIENVVNMGSVTFNGNVSDKPIYLGGIVGWFRFSSFKTRITNCANYGSVTHTGTSADVYIGGITGRSYGSSGKTISIQNSLNYGALTNNNTKSTQKYIGGISGHIYHAEISNCMSTGKVFSNHSQFYIGGIMRYTDLYSNITHSFWTKEARDNGWGNNPKIDNETSQVELNMITVGKLNEYASNNSWNKWIFNSNKASVTLKINDYKGFTVESQIILLPDLVDNERRRFTGWFNDKELTSLFTSKEVTSNTTLYGKFYAYSLPNNYTITFNFDNGTEINDIFPFNTSIDYPSIPTREGYTFSGWSPNPERMPAENITIVAQWTAIISSESGIPSESEKISEYVEIVFSKKDMNKEEAKKIIEKYTDEAEFSIERTEINDSGEFVVIIKFSDTEQARNFVEEIRASSDFNNIVKKVGFIESINSFSPALYPVLFYLPFSF